MPPTLLLPNQARKGWSELSHFSRFCDVTEFLCNLLVPGFPKSGTSSLHQYLALHPSVCMSSPKEPHFFSREDRWGRGVEFHNSCFSPGADNPTAIFGESSTTYCISPHAIPRIVESLRDPKILFLLRDPVARLISHYRWLYALGQEDRSILHAIEMSGYSFDPNESQHGNYKAYIEFSSYSKYLPLWLDRFGADIKVVFSDQLRVDPRATLEECFEFLGVGSIGKVPLVTSNRTADISRTVSVASVVRKLISPQIRRTLRKSTFAAKGARTAGRWTLNVGRRPEPTIANEDRMEISRILREETEFYHSIRACR